jgi:hypothetical protein
MTRVLRLSAALTVAAAGALFMTPSARPGEGMWLFNNPPMKMFKEKHSFERDRAWYDHVMKSSVRFNSGGSGSFVSPNGLVMTNHHVGAPDLQKFSDADGKDYMKEGFHARTPAEEKKCKALELNCLQEIIDVTDQVNAAVKPGMSPAEAFAARRAVTAQITKDSEEKTKLRSDVVTLYQGAQYHLYRYKRYTDIRLVFAPEKQAAFFGGDPDNFEYPRFDLDMCFFRVYEDDKPIKCEHYLKWSKAGAKEDELVFVSGHPGRTDRQNTMTELAYLRDFEYPFALQRLYRAEVLLKAWGDRAEENRRIAEEELFSIQNSRKARDGGLGGLLDPALMGRKMSEEQRLREAASRDAKLKDVGDAWSKIDAATLKQASINKEYTLLERGVAFRSDLFVIARELLRAAEELPKPNGERLAEYSDARLASLKLQLFSEEKIFPEFETLKLANSLRLLAEQFGADHDLVRKALAGKSPEARAYELVSGTKLADVALRKKLFEGGKAAVDASNDPMIALARLIDTEARQVRKVMESDVDEVKRQAHAQIAKAKYAVDGDSVYPDATFTLRLSYGLVKGYEENGHKVPFETTFAGLYERSAKQHNKEPFDLPPRFEKMKDKLDLSVPLNFVLTADIIGGNSGSPVINADAEVVGLIFDGNIQSLVLDFIYDETIARAVAVHSRGMIEALRKVYDANDLADELTGAKK